MKGSFGTWFHEAKTADWKKPEDIRESYSNADFIAGNRVIFNLKGNHYRLIVQINYDYGLIDILFIGTHSEYDKINAEEI